MAELEDQLTRHLQRYEVPLPAADPFADLRRGQARLRRRRLFTAVGGAGAVATVALGAALVVPNIVGSGPGVTPAASPSEAVEPSPEPTSPEPTPSEQPDARGCIPESDEPRPATPQPEPVLAEALKDYRRIVAGHLDPQERHLERWEETQGMQYGSNGTIDCPVGMIGLDSLGTKLGWAVAGQDGQGMIQVEVVRGGTWRDSSIRLAHTGWQDLPADLAGVRSAEVATYDGGTAVVVHRTDGLSVAIDANQLFGNNSLTPIDGFDFTTADLVEAAADPEFALP